MADISIFCRRAFLNINPHAPFDPNNRSPNLLKGRGHLMRVSSMIRGDQIAERLGAKLNPTSGYENDICIYIKPRDDSPDFKLEGKPYLDVVDDINLVVRHPDIPVITCSQTGYEEVSKIHPGKVVLIPQHHCNFEGVKRIRDKVETVGIIGAVPAFAYLPEGLEDKLAERGMNLIKFSRFFTRQDIIDFYQKIDVQIVWRAYKTILSNPLKLVNAAAFGIPTIALQEKWFKEMEGYYLPVHTLDEFLIELDKLRTDPSLYADYSQRCLKKAEEYHIDNICKLYREL